MLLKKRIHSNLLIISLILVLFISFDYPLIKLNALDSYDIHFYRFDLEVTNDSREIAGKAEIHARSLETPLDTLVFQLSTNMMVDSVFINDIGLTFVHAGNKLKIPSTIAANQDFIARIHYHGTPAGNPYTGIHRKYSSDYDRWVTWSFSQPFYAYKWFPCKQDHSDKIDSVHMLLRTDTTLMAVSSGILHSTSSIQGGKILFDWRTKYAISYDMIFFAVSDYILYEYYIQPVGYEDSILITNYVYNQDYIDDYKGRLDSLGLFVNYFSEILGLYPFADEKFGLVVVPGVPSTTENNTLVLMYDELEFGYTHTFIDLNCHELVHQWFGDYVACHSFRDIWLSEGFGMYGGYLGEQQFGLPGEAEKWLEKTRNNAFTPYCGSVCVPENKLNSASRIFNWNLSYCKGSLLVHMIRYELQDDELFFSVLESYINEYANGTAALDDFKYILEQLSGIDFTEFFDQWYYGEGYPILDIYWEQQGNELHIYSEETTSCDTTTLFRFTMDYKLIFEDMDTIIRLFQDDSSTHHILQVNQQVLDVIPDPDKWIMAETNIGHVGVDERQVNDNFLIYPNPAKDRVKINCQIPGLMIEVFNIKGQKIMEKHLGASNDLDISTITPGIYLVRLYDHKNQATQKLIIY